MSVVIYHNPRCSKSRETLALLESRGVVPQVELYLQKQFDVPALQVLAAKLGIDDVRHMMRTKDALYRDLGLDRADCTDAERFLALSEHSALLERPIVVNGERAKIGRPPEAVLAIL